jgi:uncharacterized protein YhaN
MKILRLDLMAFGPFEQHTLLFEQPQRGLHLVYGHNEAGKSSCRRAIGQWLFGIPHISNDNFRHASTKLRIGGLLSNELGQTLEVLRKKGRKDTLRTFDDRSAVPEESLRPFIGGLNADTFQQRFSLDHQELIRGGHALGAGSELGDVLFAAGAGIADIRTIQATLQTHCRELFLSAGANPKINVLLRQIAEIKISQRPLMLSATKWAELQQQLQQAQDRNLELDSEIREWRRELRRWERLQRAIPQVAQWHACQANLATLSHAPRLPIDFAERRIQATTNLAAINRAVEDIELRIANLVRKLDTIHISPNLLELKTVIRSLHAKLSSLQKANNDRARVIAEMRVAEDQLAECQLAWNEYGDASQSEEPIGSRLRGRLQELADQHASISERYAMCEANVKRLERDLKKLPPNDEVTTSVEVLDQWQTALRPLLQTVDLEQKAALEARRRSETKFKLAEMLQSLPIGPRTLEAAIALPVPLAETVEQYAHELTRIEQAETLAHTDLERTSQQRHAVERDLSILQHTDQVPTEAELQSIREQRNQLWHAMGMQRTPVADAHETQATQLSNPPIIATQKTPNDLRSPPLERDMAGWSDRFWDLTLTADAVADRLRREASRVAQLAQLLVDQDVASRELHRLEAKLQSIQIERQLWEQRWDSLWTPCALQPLSPREMLSWLRRFHELHEEIRTDRQQQLAGQLLTQQVEAARNSTIEWLKQSGSTETSLAGDLTDLVRRCEQRLHAMRHQQQSHDQLRQRRLDLETSLQEAREQLQIASDSRLEWKNRWVEALQEARLNPQLAARELHPLFATYDQRQAVGKELAKFRQRIAGIDRDQKSFDSDVEPLRTLDSGTAGLRPDEVVSLLHDRLTRTEQEMTKQEQWQAQLLEEQEEQQRQLQAQENWEHELRQLCQLANCSTADELAVVEKDGVRRLQCERESTDLQRQLVELAETSDLTELVSQVEQAQASDVEWHISNTQEQLQESEAKRADNSELIGRLKRELESMDGNAAAAQAQEDLAQSMAAIQHHAQQYIPLRMAATILGRVIDRYRQANQGGVLDHAGRLFADLTLGSFGGVQVELHDNGSLQLVGVRPDGSTLVPTSGMSEGTCDQLYLAFRVALLEAYLERNPPVPLLVDDLLMTFDDQRSVAALRVLADLSQRMQIIFFTHHRRLIELAQQHLSPEQFSVQTLETKL